MASKKKRTRPEQNMHAASTTPLIASFEQQCIINKLQTGQVSASAVPGAGKTTLVVLYALANPDKKIVMGTYNRDLCDATNAKLLSTGINYVCDKTGKHINRAKCFTFHGLLSALTKNVVNNDILFHLVMDRVLAGDFTIDWKWADADCVFFDESQDMRSHFWSLIKFVLAKVMKKRQDLCLMTIGDSNQRLYDFSGADVRFLKKTGRLLSKLTPGRKWSTMKLTTSYRLPEPVANFINAIGRNTDASRITHSPFKPTDSEAFPPVELYITNLAKDMPEHALNIIHNELAAGKTIFGDILILVNSCNGKAFGPASILKPLVRLLVDHGLPVYVTRSGTSVDTISTKKNVSANKIKISTFHAAKGLERKFVIVITNDNILSYNRASQFPPPIFVALSRCTQRMVVYLNNQHVHRDELEELVEHTAASDVYIEIRNKIGDTGTERVEKKQMPIKSLLELDEVYAFGETIGQLTLLDNLTVTTIQDPIAKQDDDDDDDDELDISNLHLFDDNTTISCDNGHSYINVGNIAINAIQMAIEHELRTTRHDPRTDTQVPIMISNLGKINSLLHVPMYHGLTETSTLQTMCTRYDQAISYIARQWPHDELVVTIMKRLLKAFSMVAIAVDVYTVFGDRSSVTNFNFMSTQGVHECYEVLRHNILVALGARSTSNWHQYRLQYAAQTQQERHHEEKHERLLISRMSIDFNKCHSKQIEFQDTMTDKKKKIMLKTCMDILVSDSATRASNADKAMIKIVSGASITAEHKLIAAASCYVFGRNSCVVISANTGQVQKVTVTNKKFEEFMISSLEAKVSTTIIKTDEEFFQEHTIVDVDFSEPDDDGLFNDDDVDEYFDDDAEFEI